MIRSNARVLEERIMAKLRKFLPDDERKQAVLHKIGISLQTEIQMNVVRKRIYDTGALSKSIGYEIDNDTVTVGSFGVPYAKYHEFGANLGPRGMRAMFAAMRARKATSAKRYKQGGKGVIVNQRLLARPFVRPALQSKMSHIRNYLAEYGAL